MRKISLLGNERNPLTRRSSDSIGIEAIRWRPLADLGTTKLPLSDVDFEATPKKESRRLAGPLQRTGALHDHVERHAGISGSRDSLPQLPDGQFQPAMPLNCGEELIAGRLQKAYGGKRRVIIGRTANATRALEGRAPCQYRDACWLGCPYGAYFSTQSSTLPAAAKTGKLTLKPWSIVTEVLYDKDRKRAGGVRVLDAVTEQTTDYTAKLIFICASTLNSTWLLMRSATDIWPAGLGSSPCDLGHNLMDHHFRCGAKGKLPGLDDKYYYGRRPTGIYIPRYRNLFGDKREYLRGFGYQGAASREGWSRAVKELGVGAAFKDEMTLPGPWVFGATAFGEMLPNQQFDRRHQ